MPTYGYRCNGCGVEFERFQKMTDPPVTTCDDCGGSVKKLLYPVGIQFKGSGFYINDYARASSGGAKSSNSAKTGSESSDSGSESKSAPTKTESSTPAAESKPTPSTT
jgi:putative FmdB family regulatory protein